MSTDVTALPAQRMTHVTWHDDPESAVNRAGAIETASRQTLRDRFAGRRPKRAREPASATHHAFYPRIALRIQPNGETISPSAASGFVHAGAGIYTHTASRVEYRRQYLEHNLTALLTQYPGTRIGVGISDEPIPVEYEVPDYSPSEGRADLGSFARAGYSRVLSCVKSRRHGFLLSPYDAPLFDYYWEALRHYTGTDPHNLQRYVVLYNYRKYDDVIIKLGRRAIKQRNGDYVRLVLPDGYRDGAEWQMPAIHWVGRNGQDGISFVNIGVGAPNAVTCTLAVCGVSRPHFVGMFGHVGGTSRSQRIGNVVSASGYATFCGATRYLVPSSAQITPIGEIQDAMKRALMDVYRWDNISEHFQSGTLCSVDYRHWVVDPEWYSRILSSMPAAVDMEGAEVARAAWASKTPYGFLGFITDIPAWDVPKLRGPARKFYEQTRQEFISVAVRTCDILREEIRSGRRTPHSRKISPPFMPSGTRHQTCLIPYAFE